MSKNYVMLTNTIGVPILIRNYSNRSMAKTDSNRTCNY